MEWRYGKYRFIRSLKISSWSRGKKVMKNKYFTNTFRLERKVSQISTNILSIYLLSTIGTLQITFDWNDSYLKIVP